LIEADIVIVAWSLESAPSASQLQSRGTICLFTSE